MVAPTPGMHLARPKIRYSLR